MDDDRDEAGLNQQARTGTETDLAVQLRHGVRFGSHDSKDRDVVYSIEQLPSIHQSKTLCLDKSENRNLVVVQLSLIHI